MSVRLNKVTKEFNIGLQTAVDFLKKKGYDDVEASPNCKITDQQYELLQKEFSSDKGLRSEATQLIQNRQEKSKERKEASKQKRQAEEMASAKPKASYKVVGHIELDKHGMPVKKEEPKEAPAVQPKAEEKAPKPAPEAKPVEKKAEPQVPQTAPAPTAVKPEAPAPAPVAEKPAPAPASQPTQVVAPKPVPQAPSTEERAAAMGSEVNGAYRLNSATLSAPKVLGKIDLSSINSNTRPRKKSREEKRRERDERNHTGGNAQNAAGGGDRKKRLRVGKERVDVNAVASQTQDQNGQRKGGSNNGNNQQNNGGKTKNKQKNQRKPLPVQPEVSDEEVAKQVRETLARLTNKNNKVGKGAKYRREKRDAIRQGVENEMEAQAAESKVLKLTEFVTANELATMMNVPVTQVIATCMSIGIMVSINQRMDAETINLVAEEFGFTTEYVSAEVSEAVTEIEDDEEDLVPRAPIVTVMGHVDHGKTSLLDYIRQTNVIAGEAGGITQHIGAYNVTLKDGRHVTFLDTPGHEAFTAMRARGAQVTDIAIIIIAADDDIMPQTKEAIAHATAANVPIVFAINKVDKPAANPDKIKEGLAAMNFLVEEWGGKYQSQDISARDGLNVDLLLEKVLLEAEMLDLKANPNKQASGSVVESTLDKGRGYVATVLVQSGTLRVGDVVLAGMHYGRVKALFNERGQKVKEAGPSVPVQILGLDGAPTAGDQFRVLDTEQEAREIAVKRDRLHREQSLRTQKTLTLDEIGRRLKLGDFQELNLIVKGDVDGSVEALTDSLIKLSTENIQVNVIHKAVGQISESDVLLATTSKAIIIGFNVRPSSGARRL
ncbi:MAG: translation initiation factor IF-2, partial [Bacteroidaceae bacterium]|nr:translation initiation factor IF-2 [Bacteroidaceae bacterium]